MALLNLGSSDPNLRTAAYNLLCALTSTFDLKIEGHLLETNGVCIPSNNTIFIKSVSETLAQNEPHLTLEFLEECIQVQIVNFKTSKLFGTIATINMIGDLDPWYLNIKVVYHVNIFISFHFRVSEPLRLSWNICVWSTWRRGFRTWRDSANHPLTNPKN